jgi:hypothetical protein
MLSRATTLQEEDRGRLVDVLGYGKRIERYFPGAGAAALTSDIWNLFDIERATDYRVEFVVGDFVDVQIAGIIQIGHVVPLFFPG